MYGGCPWDIIQVGTGGEPTTSSEVQWSRCEFQDPMPPMRNGSQDVPVMSFGPANAPATFVALGSSWILSPERQGVACGLMSPNGMTRNPRKPLRT